ncbi:Homeodomain-like protein [Chlamydoabsidia padenii]|nr:Homeodomain-like protein [Chlamydoabsidia padenii]
MFLTNSNNNNSNNNSPPSNKSDLMSPPMTPKNSNHDTTIHPPHDEIALLPPLTRSRKASLTHSIRAIKLVNCDTLDMIGRRFSLPIEHHQEQKRRQDSTRRRKSIPKRSPSLASTGNAACGVFTLDVFNQPRKSSIKATTTISLPSPPMTWMDNTKPKPDTFFYDHANLSINDDDVYTSSWLPGWEPFDNKPAIRVTWKGSPLSILSLPYYDVLHSNERTIASTLRLTPEQYLKCKRAMILSAQVFYQHGLPFRKSDAQKVCRIDVNKTSCLWGAFNRLGWFHPRQ